MEETLELATIGNYETNTVKNGIVVGQTIYQVVRDLFHPKYYGIQWAIMVQNAPWKNEFDQQKVVT